MPRYLCSLTCGLAVCWTVSSLCLQAAAPAAAPTPVSLEEVLRSLQDKAGVCVHVGCQDGVLSARVAGGSKLLVHALAAEEAKLKKSRETLSARGLYGRASVEPWSPPALPYVDDLVNVLVVEDGQGVTDAELLRVLAPRGAAFIQERAGWRTLAKPWPDTRDEWTHPRHGADGNMVSRDRDVKAPAALRWVAGPAQDAGGRKWYYDHALVSAYGRNFYLHEEAVTARDAFNGFLLWRRPIKPATYREKGALVPPLLQQKIKQGGRVTRVKPVATPDHLYVAAEGKLLAWDTRTGQTVIDYGAVANPRQLLVAGNRLIVACSNMVLACDLTSPAVLWKQAVETEQLVASADSALCVTRGFIQALDLATGRSRWQAPRVRPEADATCTYGDGVLVIEESSWRDDTAGCRVQAYSTADGRLLWDKNHHPGQTHYQETRSFFINGLLVLQAARAKVIALDPKTGQVKKSWNSVGHHCATPVATEHYFIAPECDFTELDTGARTRARMFKSACRLPFIPANGLLNTFPVQCECYPMLRGYMGLTSTKSPASSSQPRLERGPAFASAAPPAAARSAGEEWPTYRHDIFRSGASALELPALPGLQTEWSKAVAGARGALVSAAWQENPFVPGLLTAPVAAGGLVFVAVPDEHRLVALDAAQGQVRWSYLAGGRIDTPPTIDGGLCLFGCHDGYVYCLDAATGELAWRFRAAPSEARMMAYGQMESPWPVPGSVLVENHVAFFAAGRHPCAEDGVHVCAVRARSGDVLWETVLGELPMKDWYSPMLPTKKKVGLDFEPLDILVKDGEAVAMSRWRFQPGSGRVRAHVESTEYDAAGLPVPRGLWSYGIRQNKSVLPKPPACFNQAQLHVATTNHTAVILVGRELIQASNTGVVERNGHRLKLEAPVVHDGLITAYGRLYAATEDGRLVCLKAAAP